MPRVALAPVALVLLALVAPSCAADPAPVTACTPGAQVSCGCPGGSIGAQVCSADGSRLGPCVCSAADAGPADIVDVVQVAAPDASPPAQNDAAAPLDVPQVDAADGGGLAGDVVDGVAVDALDATDGARPDVAPVDAGPVSYDLRAAPSGVWWRVLMRTTRGVCDVVGTSRVACSGTGWRLDARCAGVDVALVATRGPDTGEGPGPWALSLREGLDARDNAERVIVTSDVEGVALNIHARFVVSPMQTIGALGIPGRTTDVTGADAWLFGCTP